MNETAWAGKDSLTLEQRVRLIEIVLAGQVQNTKGIGYLGLCVNASLDNKNHPHWDDDHVKLGQAL